MTKGYRQLPARLAGRMCRDEDGATAVDWVVLTAAIIAVAIGAVSQVGEAVDPLAATIKTSVSSRATGTE